jgi:hypothetical protein
MEEVIWDQGMRQTVEIWQTIVCLLTGSIWAIESFDKQLSNIDSWMARSNGPG